MKRIFKTNLFFLTLTAVYILFAKFLPNILKLLNVTDVQSAIYPIQLLGTFIFLWLPAIIYVLINRNKFGCSLAETLKIKKTSFNNLAFCFLAFLCLEPIAMCLNAISTYFIPNNVGDFVSTLSSSGSPLLLFFTLAIVPAIGEEVVFRGIIADGYKTKKLVFIALMNGFLFGVFHMNPCQFLYAFVLGVILTYIVEYTGSLFCSMFIHFLFNGFSCLMTIVLMSNIDEILPEIGEVASESATMALPQLMFLIIMAVIASILLYMILKKLRAINEYNEKQSLKSHLIEVDRDSTLDEFENIAPQKAGKISYIPLLISIALYIFFVFCF